MSKGDAVSWTLWGLFIVGLTIASVFDDDDHEPLTCQPGYATEYTATGHKFCRLILPDCKE